MIHKKCEQISEQYFQKCEYLKTIEEPFSLFQITQQLRIRDLQNQFQLIRALTQTKKHKMRLRSNNVFENKKNRYPQQAIFDHSRIILPQQKVQKTNQEGYVNANYVLPINYQNDQQNQHIIIMTQGPIDSTINDFRNMIESEKIDCVVMLCRIVQNGKNRCAYYLNELQISQQKTIDQHLQSKLVNLGEQHSNHVFKHVYYSQWPDKKVPTAIQHMREIIQQIKDSKRILIHCSAGLGRSGVIAGILLTILTKQYAQEKKLSIFRTIRRMRQYRYGAVQNSQQYKFLYQFFQYLHTHSEDFQ